MSRTLPLYTPPPTETPTTPAISGPSPTIHFVNVAAPDPSGVVVDSLTMVSIAHPCHGLHAAPEPDPASRRGGERTAAVARTRLGRSAIRASRARDRREAVDRPG